jgi:signal transduction histidine kinase
VGLRFRLVLLLLVPMVLVVAGYAFINVRDERAKLRTEFDLRVNVTSAAIRLAVEHALRSGTIREVERLAADLVVRQTEIVRIRLLDGSLKPRVDSNLLTGDPGVPSDQYRLVKESGQPLVVARQTPGGVRLHSVLLPLRPGGADDGVLEIAFLAGRLEADIVRESYKIIASGVLLFTLLAFVVWFALRRLVFRPVAELLQGIERVAAGERSAAVPIRSRDELGQVTAAFNRMTARLEDARQAVETQTGRTLELMRQLRHAETLATAGKLSSSIAHEVGTPLNIIAGRAELMLHALPKDSPVREDLHIVVAQIDRISQMIRATLDPFRPREPQRTATETGTVMEVVRPLLRHFARARGVTLIVSMPPDLPPVLVDPAHLQQVLINILTNALEATPKGGRVEVTGTPQGDDGQSGVAIAIRDNGPGIPTDVLPRIFDPFFTTKAPGEGTGLGLAICRDLMRRNGSEIRVASAPGEGTTFTLWLPEAKKEPS